jgi:DNA-binding transcriptional regulator GbsR (MarR family)
MMKLADAKLKFINAWGTFGTNWGINRTMAQVHALLLVSSQSLSADDIMEMLQISRGNANMNIRALIDMGLVYKSLKTGERREFFIAEKDMPRVVRQIILHRKKKELEPILQVLEEIKQISTAETAAENPEIAEETQAEVQTFIQTVDDIQLFAQKADKLLEALVTADPEWLMSSFMKMM